MRTSVTTEQGLRPPAATAQIGDTQPRDAVVVAGIVVRVEPRDWVGGPVLEVQLRDKTGALELAFFGRSVVGGLEPGAFLTAAGTVGRHGGDTVILNPAYWLAPTTRTEVGPSAAHHDDVAFPAPADAGAAIGRLHHA